MYGVTLCSAIATPEAGMLRAAFMSESALHPQMIQPKIVWLLWFLASLAEGLAI